MLWLVKSENSSHRASCGVFEVLSDVLPWYVYTGATPKAFVVDGWAATGLENDWAGCAKCAVEQFRGSNVVMQCFARSQIVGGRAIYVLSEVRVGSRDVVGVERNGTGVPTELYQRLWRVQRNGFLLPRDKMGSSNGHGWPFSTCVRPGWAKSNSGNAASVFSDTENHRNRPTESSISLWNRCWLVESFDFPC